MLPPLCCRWVPTGERSRSLALVYSGMYTGSIVGLALSPQMVRAPRRGLRVLKVSTPPLTSGRRSQHVGAQHAPTARCTGTR